MRRSARISFHLPVSIRVGSHEEECEVVEVGRGGVFLATDLSLAVHQLVLIVTTLPDGTELRVNGMVAHVVENDEAERIGVRPGVGVQFYGLGRTATHLWEEFVDLQLSRQPAAASKPEPQPEPPEPSDDADLPEGVRSLAESSGIDAGILAAALNDERDTDVIKKAEVETRKPLPEPPAGPEPKPLAKQTVRRAKKNPELLATKQLWGGRDDERSDEPTPPERQPSLFDRGETDRSSPPPGAEAPDDSQAQRLDEAHDDRGHQESSVDELTEDTLMDLPSPSELAEARAARRAAEGESKDDTAPPGDDFKATLPVNMDSLLGAETVKGYPAMPREAAPKSEAGEEDEDEVRRSAAEIATQTGLDPSLVAAALASKRPGQREVSADQEEGPEPAGPTQRPRRSPSEMPASSVIRIIGPEAPAAAPNAPETEPTPPPPPPPHEDSAVGSSMIRIIGPEATAGDHPDRAAEPSSTEQAHAEEDAELRPDDGPAVDIAADLDEAGAGEAEAARDDELTPDIEDDEDEKEEDDDEEDRPTGELPRSKQAGGEATARPDDGAAEATLRPQGPGDPSSNQAIVPVEPVYGLRREIVPRQPQTQWPISLPWTGGREPRAEAPRSRGRISRPGVPWDPSTGLPYSNHPAPQPSTAPHPGPGGFPQQLALPGMRVPPAALPPAMDLAPTEPLSHVVYRLVLPDVDALEGFARSALKTGGVFVRTRDIRPAGTPAVVIVVHPLSSDEFHLPGEVESPGSQRRGVGVRFAGVTDRTVKEFGNFIVLGIPDDDIPGEDEPGDAEDRAGEGQKTELTLVSSSKNQRGDPTGSVPRDTREIDMSSVEPLKKKDREDDHG